ncbi:MAG: maleylacetoacetate isomerase [Chromatiales bacterium]|nr:maleylacetoacetate isomerase [Chromatiales bacterium]
MFRLYSYFRSSAAYRVRIALNLKGLEHEIVPVHLLRNGGEQNLPDYTAKNPLALVPTLEHDGLNLIQSLAILEYLEETRPTPALLPDQAAARARVRALAQTIACEIHPLNNLRVLDHLVNELGQDSDSKLAWYRHWINDGFIGLEKLLANSPETGRFCHGDTPTLADCCLVPQVYNAKRFNCPLDDFPTIQRINAACNELEAFRLAAPEQQPDAE